MNNTSKRYSPEVRERAVRLVVEHQGEHPAYFTACRSAVSRHAGQGFHLMPVADFTHYELEQAEARLHKRLDREVKPLHAA